MKVFVVEHYIQREILRELSRAQSLRFSELKPDGLENNIFLYHLRQLIGQGLVEKHDAAYALSTAGLSYVARATRTNLDILPQPRLFSLLVIANEKREYVMHRRNAQPYIGQFTFPGGALAFDEDLKDHIAKQLQEKVGLRLAMTHRGTASLRLGVIGKTISHIYAQIFYAEVKGQPGVRAQDQRFAPEWVNPGNSASRKLMPDILDILEQLHQNDKYFFLDIQKVAGIEQD